jgi:CBS domain-containing protein
LGAAVLRCTAAARPAIAAAAAAVVSPAAVPAAPVRLLSTVYKASATAAATQPIQTPKVVKERGTLIDNVSTGAEGNDRTLGEIAPKDSLRDLAYQDILVSDVLRRKERFGTSLHTVSEVDSVYQAMELMSTYNIGAILVTAAGDATNVVGILSVRDFVKRVMEDGADPRKSKVSTMMSREPVYTYSDSTALHCMSLMQRGGFRHLPVRDRVSNRTIGVLSIGDCVRTLMVAFKEKNEYLEDMVAGKYPA